MIFPSATTPSGPVQSVLTHGADNTGTLISDTGIRGAIGALPSTGGVAFFPPGYYLVDQINLTELEKTNVFISAYGATFLKAGTTVGHMFVDLGGVCQNLTIAGPAVDMRSSLFTYGQTVSFYHGVRVSDLTFQDIYVYDGIEEGFKLYNCQRVRFVGRGRIRSMTNNGIQFAGLDDSSIYTGSGAFQQAQDLLVQGWRIEDTDENDRSSYLEGQAVTAYSTYAGYPVKDVRILGNYFSGNVRTIHGENNVASTPGENITVVGNTVEDARYHGIGLVGWRGMSIVGNVLRNIGEGATGGGTPSEIFGIKAGGSADPKSENVTIMGNTIVDARGTPYMEYGIWLEQIDQVTEYGNEIVGSTKADYYFSNATSVRVHPVEKVTCKVGLGSAFTLGSGAYDNIDWDVEVVDAWGMHEGVTHPERVTIVIPGDYQTSGNVIFPTGASIVGVRVIVYTGSDSTEYEFQVDAISGDDTSVPIVLDIHDLDPGDYIRVHAYQDSGGNLSVSDRSWFSVTKID